jgi:PAS domain S-box-containing protein
VERIFAAVAAASLDSIMVFGEDGVVLELNAAAEQLLGQGRDQALGRAVTELVAPGPLRDGLAAIIAGGGGGFVGRRVETFAPTADAARIPVELTVTEVEMADGRIFAANLRPLSGVGNRQELEMTRQRLELAITGAQLGVWTYDPQKGSVWYSDRSREIYGLDPETRIEARTLRSRVHPDDWEMLAVPYYQGFSEEPIEIEYRVIRPDGEVRWVHALGAAARNDDGDTHTVNGIHLDITDRKLAEDEVIRSREALHQSEKLGALGSLLAGVSHELNNPLAAIVGQAEMLEEDSRGTQYEQRARKISAAADRCARIVRTFLAMARQREPQRESIDVNDLVGSALELTEYALRTAGVRVAADLASGLPPVDGDRDQLHQVLVNLIVNAQQAMEKGGTFEKILTVRTSVDADGRVLIDLGDTGPGVPDELRRRIFEPFFTTKQQGSGIGTGIGLSFSQGIVSAHGGGLSLEPSSRGAQFRIALPAGAAAAAGGVADRREPFKASPPAEARKRAMIVEDEPDVAETLRELVEREGYEVVVAGDGSQALHALGKGEFDLLLSDLRMPLLNGQELFERLREIRPDLVERMAFVTGDTIGDSMAGFVRDCGRPTLEKPFTRAGVRTVLAALATPESGR